MSKLYFRYGAMNSGKSTALLQVAYNYIEKGLTPMIIKPKLDTKGDKKIVSRLGVEKEVNYLLSKNDLVPIPYNIDCVLVDEAQFLSKEQVDQLYEIAKINNIPVLCYGLRTDFQTNSFEGSLRLMELADELEEIKTICRCGKKAVFNARKQNGNFVFKGNQVEIDNQEEIEYDPLCGKCYLDEKFIKEKSNNKILRKVR